MADTNATRSRSRSRSPNDEGSAVAAKSYKKFSESFETWAKKHHSDENDNELFAMYKRGLRSKAKFVGELAADPEFQQEFAETSVRCWALKEAKKEVKKEAKKIIKKQSKPKMDKILKAKKDSEKKEKKPDEKPDEKEEDAKEETDNEAASAPCETLMTIPTQSILGTALSAVQDAKLQAEAKAELVVKTLTQAEKKKIGLTKSLAQMQKQIEVLKATCKKVPHDQAQIKLRAAQTDLSKVEVAIARAKDEVKSARVEFKKMEKQEDAMQKQVDAEQVHMKVEEPADSDDTNEMATVIFQAMDRKDEGTISKCDFIKSLSNSDVADFLGLPHKIRQEDESHTLMEATFQAMSGKSKTFDLTAFLAWAAARKA